MDAPRIRTTDATLARLSELYRLVAIIEDGIGSEATDSGHVIPTSARNFGEAVTVHFPQGYTRVPLQSAEFDEQFGSVPGVGNLVKSVGDAKPEFALVGGTDFRPDDGDRGTFWVCIYMNVVNAFGSAVLVRFERVET